ncbi:MAG: hypothetical protein ACJ746_14135 [Bryobacteraceae bacterium]
MIDSPEHRQLALRLAQESIVLLKNRDNFLPFDKSKIKRIAVIVRIATATVGMNIAVTPDRRTNGLWFPLVNPTTKLRAIESS